VHHVMDVVRVCMCVHVLQGAAPFSQDSAKQLVTKVLMGTAVTLPLPVSTHSSMSTHLVLKAAHLHARCMGCFLLLPAATISTSSTDRLQRPQHAHQPAPWSTHAACDTLL
jgi:hypothetical protein